MNSRADDTSSDSVRLPAPDVKGLLELVSEDAKKAYTSTERQHLLNSRIGGRIQIAVMSCNRFLPGRSLELSSATPNSHQVSKDAVGNVRQLDIYKKCLANSLCTQRFNIYRNCWSSTISELQQQKSQSALDNINEEAKRNCKIHKKALERCVGYVVSVAAREADPIENQRIE